MEMVEKMKMNMDSDDMMAMGFLFEELGDYEEDYSDCMVACYTPDHKPCFITSVEPDEDGDLCLRSKPYEESFTVETLLEELGKYDRDVGVYVAASGLYMNVLDDHGIVFFESTESGHDIVACEGVVFAPNPEDVEEDPEPAKEPVDNAKAGKKSNVWDTVVGIVFLLILLYAIYYNLLR